MKIILVTLVLSTILLPYRSWASGCDPSLQYWLSKTPSIPKREVSNLYAVCSKAEKQYGVSEAWFDRGAIYVRAISPSEADAARISEFACIGYYSETIDLYIIFPTPGSWLKVKQIDQLQMMAAIYIEACHKHIPYKKIPLLPTAPLSPPQGFE